MNPRFSGRLVAARADLAAEHLRGQVAAARYAEGAPRRVAAPLLDLTAVADPEAERATQLVHGEVFTVYEERPDGLAWGQAASDGYVGYVRADGLAPAAGGGVRVTAPWSQVYARPEVRARTGLELPCLSEVQVGGTTGGFARLRGAVTRPRRCSAARSARAGTSRLAKRSVIGSVPRARRRSPAPPGRRRPSAAPAWQPASSRRCRRAGSAGSRSRTAAGTAPR